MSVPKSASRTGGRKAEGAGETSPPTSTTPRLGAPNHQKRQTPPRLPRSAIRIPQDGKTSGSQTYRSPRIEHNVDFQTIFPGWPKGYFMGILPVTNLGAAWRPLGYPAYNYTSLPTHTLDTPFPNSEFKPTTPDPMYVACMPWCTYPYGIPATGMPQETPRIETPPPCDIPQAPQVLRDESTFLAVPTPRHRTGARQRWNNFWGRP